MSITSLQGAALLALFVLLALALLIGGVLGVRYFLAHRKMLLNLWLANTTAQERAVLRAMAQEAVAAVRAFATSPAGKADVADAVALLTAWLKVRGITVDASELEAIVTWALAQWEASQAAKVLAPVPSTPAA